MRRTVFFAAGYIEEVETNTKKGQIFSFLKKYENMGGQYFAPCMGPNSDRNPDLTGLRL